MLIVLTLGVILWADVHLWKRIHPASRAAFMEGQARGIVTVLLLLSLLLMIVGYRGADPGTIWWGPTPMLRGINNLLVLVALYLFASAGTKTWIARQMRHPMLTGVLLWAIAHLLVNGDLPSLILFGGMGLWAVASMLLINRAVPGWTPPPPGPVRKEYTTAAATLVVYLVIAWVHSRLGYPVFS